MKPLLLRLVLHGEIVGSTLILGCSQGHHCSTSSPDPVAAARQLETVATEPAVRPAIQILEVEPAETVVEEQEAGTAAETISTPIPYGHAPDYRWLTGELRDSPRGAWRLRYATPEEPDRYGGSLTLLGIEDVNGLRNGQVVHVEGEMIDPQSREPIPPYQVRRLQPLPRG